MANNAPETSLTPTPLLTAGQGAQWPFIGKQRAQRMQAELAGGQHLPIYRWRFNARRAGEERPWQYVELATEFDLVRFWNARGSIDIEPVTARVIGQAIDEAFDAGALEEKFGRPIDRLARRLGFRPCKRRRAWTVADRNAT